MRTTGPDLFLPTRILHVLTRLGPSVVGLRSCWIEELVGWGVGGMLVVVSYIFKYEF
jgi:hypothetical protein